MNNNFCKDLYDDILKTYQDSQKYRITADENNGSSRLFIEYIPVGLKESLKTINRCLENEVSFIQFQLKNPLFRISIRLSAKESGENYLFLKVYKVKTFNADILHNNSYLGHGNYSNELLVYSEDIVYSINYNNKYYPATFKSFRNFTDELIAILAKYFFPQTFVWKDFVKDRFFPPIKVTELCKFYNKRDYLEKTFDLCLPKSINKLPLKQSYAACCALKYVNDEQTELLFSSQFDFSKKYNIDKRKQKSIGIDYLYTLMSKRFSDVNMLDIIADYIYFSLQLNKKIDAFAGRKKIIKLHDELTEKIMLKANRSSKTQIRETPLKYLKMPKEFVRLKTQEALIAEGKRNHNCVGGYWKRVLEGKSLIYSADIQNEHITIEICFRKTRSKTKKYNFYISQCYKAYNRPCSPSVLEYVEKCLENSSGKAIKKYEETTNTSVQPRAAG